MRFPAGSRNRFGRLRPSHISVAADEREILATARLSLLRETNCSTGPPLFFRVSRRSFWFRTNRVGAAGGLEAPP